MAERQKTSISKIEDFHLTQDLSNFFREPFRTLDAVEELLSLCEQRLSRAPVIVAQLTGELDKTHWQTAFGALQRVHPLLTFRIEKIAGKRPKWVRHPEQMQVSFGVCSEGFTPKEAFESAMQSSFGASSSQLCRLHVLQAMGSTTLIFSYHHALLDGRGGLAIIKDLFALIAGAYPCISSTVKPSYPDVLEVADDWTYEPSHRCIPSDPDQRQNETTYFHVETIVLDADLSRAIAVEARARNLSVHGVMIGALMLTMERLSQEAMPRPYTVITSVDLRPLLHVPPVPGCLLFLIPHYLQIDSGHERDIWTIAEAVRNEVAVGRSLDTAKAIYENIVRGLRQENTPEEAYATTCAVSGDMWISNYGKLEFPLIADSLRVEKIWTASSAGKPSCHKIDFFLLNGELVITVTSQLPTVGLLKGVAALLQNIMRHTKEEKQL